MVTRLPITDVCDFQGGTQPPKSEWIKMPKDGYVRMLQIRDFTQPEKNNIEYVSLKTRTKTCKEDDVLIGRYGASIGKICTGLRGAYNVALIKTIPDLKKLNNRYLKHILESANFQHFILNVGSRAAQAGFNKDDLKNFKIPLPPLETQKRIAQILDNAAALRDTTAQLLKEYDLLAQSIFLEMFGDPGMNSKNWSVDIFGNYLKVLTDYHANGSYKTLNKNVELLSSKNYALMVRTTDLENNNFSDGVNYITERAYTFLSKSKVFGGEIIINKIGSAGKVYLMPNLKRPVSLGMNAFLLRLNNTMNYIFAFYYLKSKYGTSEINKRVKGAVTKTIRKDAVRNIPIITPPIELQNQFADKIALIEQQKALAKQEFQESEDLFNCLLQKAFKGELV